METPNSWSARDRSREASNDYYQANSAVPLNGYNDGEVAKPSDVIGEQGQSDHGIMKPVGIKVEDSQDGVLASSNPGYTAEASK